MTVQIDGKLPATLGPSLVAYRLRLSLDSFDPSRFLAAMPSLVYDRTQEHLATSDAMIIRARRHLIDAAKALRDQGRVPPGVDAPELYRMRSGGALLPKGVQGLDVLKPVHFMEADDVALALEATVGGS